MVAYFIAGVIGLLLGLAYCYTRQITTAVSQGKSTLQSIGDIVSGGAGIVKQLGITKEDVSSVFKY